MNKRNLLAFATFVSNKFGMIASKTNNKSSNIGKFCKKSKQILAITSFVLINLKYNSSFAFLNSCPLS